jgi:hypothetical protein
MRGGGMSGRCKKRGREGWGWDSGSIVLKPGKVILQHHAEGHVGLVLTGTKGQQGGQGFKLTESFNSICQKKVLEKLFLAQLVVHKLDGVGEGRQVAASND